MEGAADEGNNGEVMLYILCFKGPIMFFKKRYEVIEESLYSGRILRISPM